MTALEYLVHTHLAKAIGWTLFHSLWQGVVVALLLQASLCLVQSPRVRYACAAVAMLAVLLAFMTTLARFLPEETAAPGAIGRALRNVPAGGVLGPLALSTPLTASDVLPWFAPFWILGVALFQLRATTGWIFSRRLRRRGVCCAPDAWQRRLTRLRESLRLSKPVMLLESCLTTVPVVVGHMRPVILIPVGMLTGMPAAQVEAILLHELAHIRRSDYLANLLQTVAESILFYHPATWWISRVMRDEREHCCDDLVVAITGDAPDYANALATLEQNRWAAHDAVLAANGGNLMKRIRRLLDPTHRTPGALTPVLSAGILVITAALALTAWQATTPAQPAPGKELATPWQKWIREDVAYIVEDRERAVFANLKTMKNARSSSSSSGCAAIPPPVPPKTSLRKSTTGALPTPTSSSRALSPEHCCPAKLF